MICLEMVKNVQTGDFISPPIFNGVWEEVTRSHVWGSVRWIHTKNYHLNYFKDDDYILIYRGEEKENP